MARRREAFKSYNNFIAEKKSEILPFYDDREFMIQPDLGMKVMNEEEREFLIHKGFLGLLDTGNLPNTH